jgi:adenylate cyclase
MRWLPPGGAEVQIAVLFADVRGSTGLGESLPAAHFAGLLNRFYDMATDTLLRYEATIDKMVGDEVMALFIAGFSGRDYTRQAARAGEALLRALGYGGAGQPWLPVGVAVHAGPAFVGKFGSGEVTDFTALGDTVNTAARLQAAAAAGEVLLSHSAYEHVLGEFAEVEQRLVTVRGKSEPLLVHVLRL